MLRVLIIDRSNPVFLRWVERLARAVTDLAVQVIFVSDKESTRTNGNLEIVNVFDIQQNEDITTLEHKLGFSLHRALIPERAFFDYSSFRRCQRYSDMDVRTVGEKVQPYFNAFDYLIREQADIVIEGLADNFMSSLAGRIAKSYEKEFYMGYCYYWWTEGFFFVDRLDQTSSQVDERYEYYRRHPEQIDRVRVERVFSQKRVTWQYPGAGILPIKLRLQQLRARNRSYEPFSLGNWICRRMSALVSKVLIDLRIAKHSAALDEEFLLFPLHVSPEAALLGSHPDLADQFGLIKNISMNLPYGVKLYVKEHPSQFLGFGLDFGFYRRLTSLPNVRYFKADVSLHDLIAHRGCRGVAVINGTVGLEAAFHRKPVFVFARSMYSIAECFLKPRDGEEFFKQLQEVRRGGYHFDEGALFAILQALDDVVIRADIDVNRYQSWSDLAENSYPIYRKFLQECLKKHEGIESSMTPEGASKAGAC